MMYKLVSMTHLLSSMNQGFISLLSSTDCDIFIQVKKQEISNLNVNEASCMNPYHLVDINTLILLVDTQVITILQVSSLKIIIKCVFKAKM